MPGTAAGFVIFPFAGLRPESSESRHRGYGCEMAICPHILGTLRPQNGTVEEWPGKEGLARFPGFPDSLLPMLPDGGG